MHTDYHSKRDFYAQNLFEKKTSLPFRYVLILTNKCNLACSFCFQERKNRKDAMKKEDWLKAQDNKKRVEEILDKDNNDRLVAS